MAVSDKRDALTAAAASLFWTKGYAATSLADISTQSGVPLRNIYYYFRSKTALADAVTDIFVTETKQMIDQIAIGHDDPRQRMRTLIERLQRAQIEQTNVFARTLVPEIGQGRLDHPFHLREVRLDGLLQIDIWHIGDA